MNTYRLPIPAENRPLSLQGEGFELRVQTLEDAEADYRTVMANREHLRAWCADTWPEDDFTLEQNRQDLRDHIGDAEEGFAYGYTVWEPATTIVLGSVYLYPSAYFADRYQLTVEQRSALEKAVVLVDYWLGEDLERSRLHGEFARALRTWLGDQWGYRYAAWATRPPMDSRRELYDQLGFSFLGMAESVHTPGWFQAWHLSE